MEIVPQTLTVFRTHTHTHTHTHTNYNYTPACKMYQNHAPATENGFKRNPNDLSETVHVYIHSRAACRSHRHFLLKYEPHVRSEDLRQTSNTFPGKEDEKPHEVTHWHHTHSLSLQRSHLRHAHTCGHQGSHSWPRCHFSLAADL